MLTIGYIVKRLSVVAPLSLTLLAGLSACRSASHSTVTLQGAGATLPAPLYTTWFDRYEAETIGVTISYDATGSGDGVEQFINQTVDFAATDAPLTDTERAQLSAERGNVLQIPTVGISVVMAYNLPGVEELALSRDAYCGIATGDITQWNDAAIAASNPDVSLPDLPITFVHRADSSGTTYIFTNHLNEACDQWTAGAAKRIDWVVGAETPGNLGMTAMIQQTEGAIGYVGFTHAEQAGLPMASLENKAGFFIEPSPNAAERATVVTSIPDDMVIDLPDPENVDAYPIIGLTYLLMYETYPSVETAQALNQLVRWSMADGRAIANLLGYAPLSPELSEGVEAVMHQQQIEEASTQKSVSTVMLR
ncbi:MAG: phosphate ABC transporter substrate-binding protein PstS [Cyanobacteria bacterium J06633_2]